LFAYQASAQDIKTLFEQDSFEQIKALATHADEMDGESLYILGMSFYYTDDFEKASQYLAQSINKGFTVKESYSGLAMVNLQLKQFAEARSQILASIQLAPKSQMNYAILANTFYYEGNLDSALHYFYIARDLDFETGEPYLSVPHIYHVKKDYQKALEEYYVGIELQPKVDGYYLDMLKEIGILEYILFKNFDKSAKVFIEFLAYEPDDYEIKIKLMKTWNAMNMVKEADSLFAELKADWELGKLPERHQKRGSIPVDEFEWQERTVLIYRNFKEPQEVLEIKFLIYLLDEKGEEIDRVLQTEKTYTLKEGSVEHLLCEWTKNRVHLNYGIGWRTEDMTVPSLRKTAIQIFEENRGPAAASSFGNEKAKKGKKKKKK
jgi:tetratricopeptide (TPR) repeat protein